MLEQNNVGSNIRAARKNLNKTQREIAEAANISTTQLSAYETGSRTPNIDTLALLAKALNKSIDELYFGEKGNPQTNSLATKGELIVDSVVKLYDAGVVGQLIHDAEYSDYYGRTYKTDCIILNEHFSEIDRLVDFLVDFNRTRATFTNPDNHLKEMCESVAREIDSSYIFDCPF